MDEVKFDSFRLEAWSTREDERQTNDAVASLREALRGLDMPVLGEEEDSVPLKTHGGKKLGMVRFRFSCDYVHRRLVHEFFEKEFVNPGRRVGDQGLRAWWGDPVRERAHPPTTPSRSRGS